jgi:phage baseplate assembly protein V
MDDRAEPSRLLGDLIRLGVVTEAAGARCRVRIDDDLETDWINMPVSRAGRVRTWSPLSIGEQVIVSCPEGEIASAAITGVLNCDAYPPPAADGRTLILFDDGCEISYDPDGHRLAATLPAGGVVDLVAPGGVNITGDLKVTGKISGSQDIVAEGDVQAGDISLKTHPHELVKAGTDRSGKPVS